MAIAEVSEDGDAPSGRDVALPEALDLLIRAATLLFVNGQTTERAKKSVEDLAHSFGFHAAVFLHWDDLRIQISDGVASRSETVAVNHPRWEPYAGIPPVRFCAGGAQQ